MAAVKENTLQFRVNNSGSNFTTFDSRASTSPLDCTIPPFHTLAKSLILLYLHSSVGCCTVRPWDQMSCWVPSANKNDIDWRYTHHDSDL